MRFPSALLPLLLCALPLAAGAEAVRYELDPVHTRVLVAVSHAGFSDALGTVSGSSGELWFDPDDWSSAHLSASIPIAELDLGDAQWNRAALGANLLDADDYPTATFVSTRVEPVDDDDGGRARVYGMLSLRGVEREVVLEVTLNAARRHPMPPFRRTVGFSATATLSRKAFGMDAWPTVIGDEVEVRIEAEATRHRAREAEPASDTTPPETPSAPPEDENPPDPLEAADAEPAPQPATTPETEPEPDPASEAADADPDAKPDTKPEADATP